MTQAPNDRGTGLCVTVTAKDGQQPPQARKKQIRILLYGFQREHGPADTLTSDFNI